MEREQFDERLAEHNRRPFARRPNNVATTYFVSRLLRQLAISRMERGKWRFQRLSNI